MVYQEIKNSKELELINFILSNQFVSPRATYNLNYYMLLNGKASQRIAWLGY